MKINIIADLSKPTEIIPRLFTALSEHAHFTISDIPDDSADVNYFSLYVLYPKEGYTKTKTAALFSHKEINSPNKIKEWNRVKGLVDLRLYWSDLYASELEASGKSAKVTIFLDREKFNLS
jgi:hypothetical protein